MDRRQMLMKALTTMPIVTTLGSGAAHARQSILCVDKPESYEIDPDTGAQRLTASCMNSLGVQTQETLING